MINYNSIPIFNEVHNSYKIVEKNFYKLNITIDNENIVKFANHRYFISLF